MIRSKYGHLVVTTLSTHSTLSGWGFETLFSLSSHAGLECRQDISMLEEINSCICRTQELIVCMRKINTI